MLWELSVITSASSALFLLIGLVGFGVALLGFPQESKTVQSSLATTEDRSASVSG